MTATQIARRLTKDEIEFFHREGYLVVDHVFEESDLQPTIDEINDEVTRRAEILVKEGLLPRTYVEYGFERQLAKISAHTDKVATGMWNGVLATPGIFSAITHPKLLDIVEQICGPELIASSVYRLRPKIPNYSYGAVPWHQDSAYFEPYCDKALVMTCWLPLVDADNERGCLWVMPKAHRDGKVVKHMQARGKAYLEIFPEDLPKGYESVCCPVKKGGVLLMTNLTPHVSYENTTDIVRWSMDLRYQSAALPTNADISRLEGEDMPDPESGVPVACYPPEADFLVRSRKRPNEVMKDAEAFRRLREGHVKQQVTNRWNATWK